MNNGHQSEHHFLISCSQILKKLLCLFSLKFHVIRKHCGKVIIGILSSLPVCGICLNTKHPVFHFSYRLICRNRNNIDTEHQIPGYISKLRHNIILEICGIVLQKHHSSVLFPHHKEVIRYLDRVR